jgi:hypothetical protein
MNVPIAGAALGLVKGGGNVSINPDGTMTAPTPKDGGLIVTKEDFTIGDPRWGAVDSDGIYTLNIPNAGAQFFKIFMEEDVGEYIIPICDVRVTNTTTSISTITKFAGYILQGNIEPEAPEAPEEPDEG